MSQFRLIFSVLWASLVLISCSSDNREAKDALSRARQYYAEADYVAATQEIDSLKKSYPKAFDEIKASLSLLDSVRRGENELIIRQCDSMLINTQHGLDSLRKLFHLRFDKKYDEKATYIPKEGHSSGLIRQTTLRSGVVEDGDMFIESIFVGNSKRHYRLKITDKDGNSVQTENETGDGLNYKTTTPATTYEIIKFVEAKLNGLPQFIDKNKRRGLTATLEGDARYSYKLPQQVVNSLSQSYRLSSAIKRGDSLIVEKDKAQYKIEYLDNRGQNKPEQSDTIN